MKETYYTNLFCSNEIKYQIREAAKIALNGGKKEDLMLPSAKAGTELIKLLMNADKDLLNSLIKELDDNLDGKIKVVLTDDSITIKDIDIDDEDNLDAIVEISKEIVDRLESNDIDKNVRVIIGNRTFETTDHFLVQVSHMMLDSIIKAKKKK